MNDRIEKRIELKAPVSRVWRALTDHREFGEWFRVKLDGPFVPGHIVRGQITYQGYEHVRWEATIQKLETERLLSFTWHPYAVDPDVDYTTTPAKVMDFAGFMHKVGRIKRLPASWKDYFFPAVHDLKGS